MRDQETLAEELSLTGRILIWIEMMHQVNISLRVIKRLVEYRKNHQFNSSGSLSLALYHTQHVSRSFKPVLFT